MHSLFCLSNDIVSHINSWQNIPTFHIQIITVSIYAVHQLHPLILLNKKCSPQNETVLLGRRVNEYEIFTAELYNPPAHTLNCPLINIKFHATLVLLFKVKRNIFISIVNRLT